MLRKKILITVSVLCLLLLSGCGSSAPAQTDETAPIPESSVQFAQTVQIDDMHLRDVNALYEDDPYEVVTMYLTVREGNTSEGTEYTWEEVNSHSAFYYDEMGIPRYKAACLLQVGDETGPLPGMLGYGETLPNATVQIRGQTSSRNAQKNYKIKLVDNSDGWRGQRTIALNKHMTEGMRFRNKLAYDLLADIPQIMSLRTQFVHLYVRDMTGDNPDEFEDYGLYTQVEQLNKTAMRAHGLDKNGYLYKINEFEFLQYDAMKLITDPDYDEAAFNFYMETKGRSDHTRLLEMLAAVNDYSVSSDELLDNWFDRENLAYWMGFMMLIGNSDTQSRNMYIYSPLNGNKWYIYPWDNDGCLSSEENLLKNFSISTDWQDGVTNYWGNMLFQRALMSDSFREQLTDAVEDLKANYLTPERLNERIEKYSEVICPYLYRMPDVLYAPLTQDEYRNISGVLADEIDQNYERIYESLHSPMPFYVDAPVMSEGGLSITWNSSFDFDNQDLRYHVWLARDYSGNEILMEQENLLLPQTFYSGTLEPGQYFLHVCAANEDNLSTNCFDLYTTTDGYVFGVLSFFIEEDGSINVYQNSD